MDLLLEAQLRAARQRINAEAVRLWVEDAIAELEAWHLILTAKPGQNIEVRLASPYGLANRP